MNKADKDSYFKQLAIRHCLAQGQLPCPEVVIYSPSDLTRTPEALTDMDVVGLELLDDGRVRRTLFDCKTGKMSAINRALWAKGLMDFAGVDHAFVILNKAPLQNHRLAAADILVDLHSEETFTDLAALSYPQFNSDLAYQSTVDRWRAVGGAYEKWAWSFPIFECVRYQAPVSRVPAKTFRRLISILRSVRGEFDPQKKEHRSIFFDSLCGYFVLWSGIARDIRRIFRTNMSQDEFLELLRFYLWGGQEAYEIRKEISKSVDAKAADPELPEWGKLEKFTSHAISNPGALLKTAWVCRELSLREVNQVIDEKDAKISDTLKSDSRVPQLLLSGIDYLSSASRLPTDMQTLTEATVGDLM